jgi:predicted MPP superfamily phosphohydrolase
MASGTRSRRSSLCLAGHTHGGQIRAGSLAPFVPPGSGRFVAGWYETEMGPLYVSRGTGTSIVPARFCCRPELPVFELVRG